MAFVRRRDRKGKFALQRGLKKAKDTGAKEQTQFNPAQIALIGRMSNAQRNALAEALKLNTDR